MVIDQRDPQLYCKKITGPHGTARLQAKLEDQSNEQKTFILLFDLEQHCCTCSEQEQHQHCRLSSPPQSPLSGPAYRVPLYVYVTASDSGFFGGNDGQLTLQIVPFLLTITTKGR